MKNAIILHGKPKKTSYYDSTRRSQSNSHWLPWLQQQLIVRGVKADTPEVPRPYDPKWDIWVREVERFEIGPETILVGHSCGGGFWLRYLSERKDLRVGKVVLVAPWIDVEKDSSPEFFDFELDPNLASRTKSLTVFISTDDVPEIISTYDELKKSLKKFKTLEFENYGHFTYNHMSTEEFPELLEEVLNER